MSVAHLGAGRIGQLHGRPLSATPGLDELIVAPRTAMRSVEPGVPPLVGPRWPHFTDRFAAAYAAELGAFIQVARVEIPSPCDAADGVAALRVTEAASRSLHAHRPCDSKRSRADSGRTRSN